MEEYFLQTKEEEMKELVRCITLPRQSLEGLYQV
jgi:hypothetical protein